MIRLTAVLKTCFIGAALLIFMCIVSYSSVNDSPQSEEALSELHGFRASREALSDTNHGISKNSFSVQKAIPRVIHQTWDDAEVPGQVANWVRSWEKFNPEFEYHFWTDAGTRQLLEQRFVDEYEALYDDYPHRINRADVRRLLILYEYGGVFADLDVECLQPLPPILSKYECVVSLEPTEHQWLIYNNSRSLFALTGFMACTPHHPFLALVLKRLSSFAANARSSKWNLNILNSTGPVFISEVIQEYVKYYNNSGHDLLHVAPSDLFIPTFDPSLTDSFRVKCQSAELNEGQKAICEDLRRRDFVNVPSSRAITDHHWMHSWADHFVPRGFKDIASLVPNVHIDLPSQEIGEISRLNTF